MADFSQDLLKTGSVIFATHRLEIQAERFAVSKTESEL